MSRLQVLKMCKNNVTADKLRRRKKKVKKNEGVLISHLFEEVNKCLDFIDLEIKIQQ